MTKQSSSPIRLHPALSLAALAMVSNPTLATHLSSVPHSSFVRNPSMANSAIIHGVSDMNVNGVNGVNDNNSNIVNRRENKSNNIINKTNYMVMDMILQNGLRCGGDIGGSSSSSGSGSDANADKYSSMGYSYQVPDPNEPQNQQQGGGDVFTGGGGSDSIYGYRETVEDRAIAWRRQQQQLQQTQSATEAVSAVDEQGRFKLFTTVSRVSVSFFFFILMWRTVHHYELADATFGSSVTNTMGAKSKSGIQGKALLRVIVVTPLVVLFLGEMMGALLGLAGGGMGSSTSHTTKKRLKGVLNLHKGVELVLLLYNVMRLTVWPSKHVPREIYIGRTVSNFFFLVQAQLYTKLSWDDVSKTPVSGENYGMGGVSEPYYDDYASDMSGFGDQYSSWQGSNANTGSYEMPDVYDQRRQQQQQQTTGFYQQQTNNNQGGWN